MSINPKIEISYSDWLKKNFNNSEFSEKTFNIWWRSVAQKAYIECFFNWLEEIKCKNFHKILFSDTDFFKNIEKYVSETNFYDKETDINDMIYMILELSFSSYKFNCICMTGGFEVYFKPNVILHVKFCDNNKVIADKKIDISHIRKNKLDKISDD